MSSTVVPLRPIEQVVISASGAVDVDGVHVGQVASHPAGRGRRWMTVVEGGRWASPGHRTRRAAVSALVQRLYGQDLPE